MNKFIDEESDSSLKKLDDLYYLHFYKGRQTIKDRIESIGIPHPELALILKNGSSVNFDYLVKSGDFFSVYPYFQQLSPSQKKLLIPIFEGRPRFVLDVHLGKLARYLRRFGFDTAYSNQFEDKQIVDISLEERRIILSRDLGLLKRSRVKWAKYLFKDEPKLQLKEVAERFKLADYYQKDKSRCVDCNTELIKVKKENIIERLEPKTKKYFDDFVYCPNCDKIYWRGSHFSETEKWLLN